MTAMRLSWRQPPEPLGLAWRGPDDALMRAIARSAATTFAAVIGPQGPQGPAGSSITTVSAVAQVNITAGFPLTLNRANGQLKPATAGYKPDAFVVGLAAADCLAGFTAEADSGMITRPDWTAVAGTALLSPGLPYFLTVAGGLSTNPPAAPNCLTLIGVAVGYTTLHVDPGAPVQL
jgi:hypothetical protein